MLTIDFGPRARWKWALALAVAAVLIVSSLGEPRVDIRPVLSLPTAQSQVRPIYKVKTDEKKVALTFDISWGTKMHGPVLDILKREGVKSTFFLSGPWSARYPEVVRRIAADGHQIESHGHKHDNFSRLGHDGVIDNIQTADAILTELAGRKPKHIRPPNGDFDDVSLAATDSIGYKTIIWSVDSRDWMNPGVDVITERVLKLTGPGDIILMHASDSCKQTDQALPAIIAGLRERGFEFVTLDELLELGEPIIPTLAPVEAAPDAPAATSAPAAALPPKQEDEAPADDAALPPDPDAPDDTETIAPELLEPPPPKG